MDGSQPAGNALRWTRASVLAAVALSTGVALHVGADGLLPGPAALLTVLAVSILAAAPFLGRPASQGRVVAMLVAWQALIHVALTVLAGHRGDSPATRAGPTMPQHAVAPSLVAEHRQGSFFDQMAASPVGGTRPGLVVPHWLEHLVADFSGPHAAMAVGHLVAAGFVGLWLAAGERALWRVLSAASRSVVTAVLVLMGHWPRPVPGTPLRQQLADRFGGGPLALLPLLFVRVLPRRGPPVTT